MSGHEVEPRWKAPQSTTPKSRKPLRAKRKPQAEIEAERIVRAAVLRRDQWRCLWDQTAEAGPCSGPLTFHHVRKDGQGGEFTEANGATLCNGHNCGIEADPKLQALALSQGLWQKGGDTIERCWRRRFRAGLTTGPEVNSPRRVWTS